LLVLEVAALVVRIREPSQAADLPPIAKLPPGEELHDIEPRTVDPDAAELIEFPHLRDRRIIGGAE